MQNQKEYCWYDHVPFDIKKTQNQFISEVLLRLPMVLSKYCSCNVTSERSERCSYKQSYICSLDDIKTALKPFKKIGKNEYTFLWLF